MPNISQLDDTAFSVDSLRLDGAPAVTMKLGGHEFTFEDGQWVVGEFLLAIACCIYECSILHLC